MLDTNFLPCTLLLPSLGSDLVYVYLCCVTTSSLFNVSGPQFSSPSELYMDMYHWCVKYPHKRGRFLVDGVLRDGKGSVLHKLSSRRAVPGGRSSVHTAVHLQTNKDINLDREQGSGA